MQNIFRNSLPFVILQTCNIKECGFDTGDCGVSKYSELYGLDLTFDKTDYTIQHGKFTLWKNIYQPTNWILTSFPCLSYLWPFKECELPEIPQLRRVVSPYQDFIKKQFSWVTVLNGD